MAERAEKGGETVAAAVRKGGFGAVLWITLVIIAALGGAAGAWVVAYERGLEAGIAAAPPLITADVGPTKVPPEDPGGLEVPNQDVLLFDAIDEGAETPGGEEVLAPAPEEPLAVAAPEPPRETELAAADDVMAEPAEADRMAAGPASAGTEAAEDEVLLAPGPELVEAAMDVAVAPETASPEALKIEADGAPEAIVLEPPPQKTEVAELEIPEPEMANMADSAAPAEAAPRHGPRVQLAAFRSPERAEVGWERIVAAHQALLGDLDHTVVRVDLGEEKGIFHRLQAGPMADAEAAKALCATLRDRDQGCLVVAP